MSKSKIKKNQEMLFKIIKQWEKEEPENFKMNNRIPTTEHATMGLLSYLIRTDKIKGV